MEHWIARDGDGWLGLYTSEPKVDREADDCRWFPSRGGPVIAEFNSDVFPEILPGTKRRVRLEFLTELEG